MKIIYLSHKVLRIKSTPYPIYSPLGIPLPYLLIHDRRMPLITPLTRKFSDSSKSYFFHSSSLSICPPNTSVYCSTVSVPPAFKNQQPKKKYYLVVLFLKLLRPLPFLCLSLILLLPILFPNKLTSAMRVL